MMSMNFKRFLLVFGLLLLQKAVFCTTPEEVRICLLRDSAGTLVISDLPEAELEAFENNRPNPLFFKFRKKQTKNKKIVAALLAFPFPFGIVGLHRIYLGCAPYVPVAYIASLGGIFGILPLIDFCVLLFDKDYEHYEDNGKVFMWIR